MGTVIGHEITHAFDTNGARYDENGNYSDWWTQEDMTQFMAKAEKVKDYFSLNKVRVNAVLPLFDQFYDAYGITKNDDMYVAKEDRIQIW